MAVTAYKRNMFRVNRFQRPIVNLVLFPCVFVSVVLVICMALSGHDAAGRFHSWNDFFMEVVNRRIFNLLACFWALLLFILMITYRVSNILLGPFERMLKELDDVIQNKKKKTIIAREEDELANELLKRINVLIDRMQV